MPLFRTCMQCNDDFIIDGESDTRLVCSTSCRHKFWKTKPKGISTQSTLDDLRYEIGDCKKFVRGIKSSIGRIENDYSDWEDRVVAIENKIYELEKEVEIEEKLETPNNSEVDFNIITDLLG